MKLDELMKDMNKKANADVVSFGLPTFEYKKIPFTSPRMNYCTFGGLPIGRLIEFYGEEHGGKTTTALDIIANYQRMDEAKKVLYIDAENTLDADWAMKLGVDLSDAKFICFNPVSQSAEEIFQFILDAVDTGEIGLWVLDSIPSLASAQELDKTMEERTFAGISSQLTTFARRAETKMHHFNCTGIGINQLRDDLGAMYPGAKKTPGGNGWKHFCSVRMLFSKGKYIDDKGNDMNQSAESPAGNYILMKMTKNKCCPPTRRTGFYTLNYEYGIDYLKDLLDLAVKHDVVQKSGAWYSIIDVDTGEVLAKLQGMSKVYEYLENEEHESVLSNIEKYIDNLIC